MFKVFEVRDTMFPEWSRPGQSTFIPIPSESRAFWDTWSPYTHTIFVAGIFFTVYGFLPIKKC